MNDDIKEVYNDSQNFAKKAIKKVSKKTGKKVAIVLALVVVVAIVLYALYVRSKPYQIKKADREVSELMNDISKHIVLPEGIPSVFTIEDPELLLKGQAFFKGAEKGDRLMVYPQAGKAIIYSPERDILINVGPVTFDETKSPVGTKAE